MRAICYTLDKEYVQEDKIAQLKCADGVIKQTSDVFGSDLAAAIHGSVAKCPAQYQCLVYLEDLDRRNIAMFEDAERHYNSDDVADDCTECMARILLTSIAVEREKWVSMKRYLLRAKAEVVHLNGHLWLLNKFNDRLERECENMKARIHTFRMKV